MSLDCVIVGGGMITELQILPSLLQMQRLGEVGEITISSLNARPLKKLAESKLFTKFFPGQGFTPMPNPAEVEDLDAPFPDKFNEAVESLAPHNMVVVAVPDQFHYPVVKAALDADQHILCVKPLCLKAEQAKEIEEIAYEKGLLVGIEYHKRFDRRNFMARKDYRAGEFGEFCVGQATLVECWDYRFSNFQNWFTPENTDPFAYIGCHYVDLVAFITGLKPTEVSVVGKLGKFPNGNEGYMWSDGRVKWENGAYLSVMTGLGYPLTGDGSNMQGMSLHFETETDGGYLQHQDQFRGIRHCYATGCDPEARNNEPNPDYFRMIYKGGEGRAPEGYGYDSIVAIVNAAARTNKAAVDASGAEALALRQGIIKAVDADGIVATPANSAYNELVVEAGRLSILNDGKNVLIDYDTNSVRLAD